jgi:hypothetical protein
MHCILSLAQKWGSCQNYWPSMSQHNGAKKIPKPWDSDTVKKRTKTAITWSVFDRQHSWWCRHVAAITTHSAMLSIVVFMQDFNSSCLRSAVKVAGLFTSATVNLNTSVNIIPSILLSTNIHYHPSISIYNTPCCCLINPQRPSILLSSPPSFSQPSTIKLHL